MHVDPLNCFETIFSILVFWWETRFFDIFEFIFNVWLPSNLWFFYSYFSPGVWFIVDKWHLSVFVLLIQSESIVEITLGHQAAWDGWISWLQWIAIQVDLLIGPKMLHFDNWVTISQLRNLLVLSRQLVIVSWFNVSSVILVEVVKLVVHIDWPWDFVDVLESWRSLPLPDVDWQVSISILSPVLTVVNGAILVVSVVQFDDPIAHNLQHNSDGQKDHRKNTESKHGAHGRWYGSPSRKSLLLELGLLELFDLLSDTLLLFRWDVHNNFNFLEIIYNK